MNLDTQLVIEVDRAAMRLGSLAGAFTPEAVHRSLPFCGYRLDEVEAVLAVLAERGYLTGGPLVWFPKVGS